MDMTPFPAPATFLDAVASFTVSESLARGLAALARHIAGAQTVAEACARATSWRSRCSAESRNAALSALRQITSEPCLVADALEAELAWVAHCEAIARESRRRASGWTTVEREFCRVLGGRG